MPALSPEFKPDALLKLDRRTREARLLATIRRDLTAHVGGKPSTIQRALIERAAMLTLHLALIDERSLSEGGRMSDHDSRQYLAWSNTYARTIARLGMTGTKPTALSLSDYLDDQSEDHAP